MDMVIAAGKSRKNVTAYILIPPDTKEAIDALLHYRDVVGVPRTNMFMFARMHADTPMSGHSELREVVASCPGIQRPQDITSTSLRKYVATVSQVSVLLLLRVLQ